MKRMDKKNLMTKRMWKARVRKWLKRLDESPSGLYQYLLHRGYRYSFSNLYRGYREGVDSLSFITAIAEVLGKRTWEIVKELEEGWK